ncbi:MAG TPA: hypothetical protein VGR35_04190 [Tepidisphaeraceae bacterium]|nr:hypothetical protein [Tepidisphaeraceae bacterium]
MAARCWHAALEDLEGGRLWTVFTEFARRFPDHPSPANTHVYLTFQGEPELSPPMWGLSWRCSHFEHGGDRDDLLQLVEFLDLLGSLGVWPDAASLDLIDLTGERIRLELLDPAPDVRDEVISRGRELREWQPMEGEGAAE